MISPTNPTTAKLRKMFLIVALGICSLFTVATQAQDVPASLTNGVGGQSTFDVLLGQSFTLTLNITTTFPSSGVTFFLATAAENSTYFFLLSSSLPPGAPYPDPTANQTEPSDPDYLFLPGNREIDPVSHFDLGFTNNGSNTDPANFYSVVSYLFGNNAPVGTYTIFTQQGIVTDRTAGAFTDRPFTALATINVIPEPATVGLAVLGGGMLLVVAWRKKRAQA